MCSFFRPVTWASLVCATSLFAPGAPGARASRRARRSGLSSRPLGPLFAPGARAPGSSRRECSTPMFPPSLGQRYHTLAGWHKTTWVGTFGGNRLSLSAQFFLRVSCATPTAHPRCPSLSKAVASGVLHRCSHADDAGLLHPAVHSTDAVFGLQNSRPGLPWCARVVLFVGCLSGVQYISATCMMAEL
jgi:hypothetical protein